MINHKDEQYLKAFGENLKRIRNEKGMTQSALADYAGIERSQIMRIEKGDINTTINTVRVLSKTLGIEAKELFDF